MVLGGCKNKELAFLTHSMLTVIQGNLHTIAVVSGFRHSHRDFGLDALTLNKGPPGSVKAARDGIK